MAYSDIISEMKWVEAMRCHEDSDTVMILVYHVISQKAIFIQQMKGALFMIYTRTIEYKNTIKSQTYHSFHTFWGAYYILMPVERSIVEKYRLKL